jgi:hypothetical protein
LPRSKARRSATAGAGTTFVPDPFHTWRQNIMGRSILLWLLGVPIPIIILLALFWH